jgi:tagatose 1,6-diphosphate aldolase
MNLSIGKLRGLQQLSNSKGFLTMCAIDHRGALKRALNKENPQVVTYQEMVDFKVDLCKAVVPFASATLLDPEFGAAQVISAGVLPGSVGLLVSREKTGYTGKSSARVTELLEDWNVSKIKRLGASAVKILLYFRPDLEDVAPRQLKLIADLAKECTEFDIPLLVEPVSYALEEERGTIFADLKPKLVIETARQITSLPIDVLKAEFPADMKIEQDESKLLNYCKALNDASRLPWVILSAGVDFDTFRRQVEIACRAGASGFLAGRALWQEGAGIQSREERMEFFKATAAPRLGELAAIAEQYGKPWYLKLGAPNGIFPSVDEHWYQNY